MRNHLSTICFLIIFIYCYNIIVNVIFYYIGGHGTLLGVINSFIHVVMYTYYLISGLGPQYQKLLWWKSHVTTLQLVSYFYYCCHSLKTSDNEIACWLCVVLCKVVIYSPTHRQQIFKTVGQSVNFAFKRY